MAQNPSNSSNLEQLALKGLILSTTMSITSLHHPPPHYNDEDYLLDKLVNMVYLLNIWREVDEILGRQTRADPLSFCCWTHNFEVFRLCVVQLNAPHLLRSTITQHILNVNPLKCSGIRWLHTKLFNAIQH